MDNVRILGLKSVIDCKIILLGQNIFLYFSENSGSNLLKIIYIIYLDYIIS